MPLHAILFGGLSALAEIDALDHQALDAALQEVGEGPLSFARYRELAQTPDGPGRMERASDGDGAPLFAAKQEILRARVAEIGLTPRPGVAEVLEAAEAAGVRLGLVSDLDEDMRTAMFDAFAEIEAGTFDAVAADWAAALEGLGAAPADCVVIAADPETVAAAEASGLPVVAFYGAAHRGRDVPDGPDPVAALSAEALGLPRPA